MFKKVAPNRLVNRFRKIIKKTVIYLFRFGSRRWNFSFLTFETRIERNEDMVFETYKTSQRNIFNQ